MFVPVLLLSLFAGFVAAAEISSTNASNPLVAPLNAGRTQPSAKVGTGLTTEEVRTRCIDGRRYIAGRVLQVNTNGIVVDSGYSKLLSPPFNRSWVVPGTASVNRD